MISQTQQQSRVAPPLSVSPVSVPEFVSVTQPRTAVYAGFMLGSPLPALHHPGSKAGFLSGFVAYSETVTIQVHTSYRFSASSQARPQTKDPVQALFERTREHPACAMLFEQTTTYRITTTVSVLYFDYVCWQGLAPAHSRGVAPSPKPMPMQSPRQLVAGNAPAAPAAPSFKPVPQAANVPASAPVPPSSAPAPERPGAAVSLKPVESSKASDPFDWEKRPFDEMRHRYEVWNALGQEKPRVEFSLKASPKVLKTVTPRKIDEKGLSFSAVDANGNVEEILFSDVSRVRVLSA